MKKHEYLEKLHAWFGENQDGDSWVMHTWFEPTADAPTLYAIVAIPGELMFMRVYNTVGRLQVHCDRRVEQVDIDEVMHD